jgi:pSer/pThr/pTyr-binding forkhead associated (FHA) protein
LITDTTLFMDHLVAPSTQVRLYAQIRAMDPTGAIGAAQEVGAEDFIIGRGLDADLVLADDQASRHHAVIKRVKADYVVEDNGSTNGCFVNGVRIVRCPLQPGDQIQLGGSKLYFTLGYRFDVG